MLAYSLALVPVSLLPWLGGELGPLYAAIAAASGVWFALRILRSMRAQTRREDRQVLFASIVYLTVLFAAMLVELLLVR
jgi:heme O synthase-like polyprenyltransferase